jgi:UDP-glucose 4-epimerase
MTTPARTTRPELSPCTVLVTGATGYMGSRLVSRLVADGHEVHAASRVSHAATDSVRWWQADLAEADQVRKLFGEVRPELVFHLAGDAVGRREQTWVLPLLRGHVLGTANVLEHALEVGARRIIMTGSMEEPEPSGEWACPSSPYAAAKWASSGYARMFHALYGSPVVILRVFMVYGPGPQDLRKLIPHVALSLLRGEAPALSSGTRRIDWVYLDDVVQAFLAAASTGADVAGLTLDVGSGELVTIRALVGELVRIIQADVEPSFGALADRALEQVRAADPGPAARALNWVPRTSLAEGLRRTVDWYRTLPEAAARAPAGG